VTDRPQELSNNVLSYEFQQGNKNIFTLYQKKLSSHSYIIYNQSTNYTTAVNYYTLPSCLMQILKK